MIRRTLILGAVLLTTVCLNAGAAAPARAASLNDQMRDGVMALRGLIDRAGGALLRVPTRSTVRPGHLGDGWWPADPWTGSRMRTGVGHGHYLYKVTRDRRHYRLIGYLDGRVMVVRGGMPHSIMRAYDHRSEEGTTSSASTSRITPPPTTVSIPSQPR